MIHLSITSDENCEALLFSSRSLLLSAFWESGTSVFLQDVMPHNRITHTAMNVHFDNLIFVFILFDFNF